MRPRPLFFGRCTILLALVALILGVVIGSQSASAAIGSTVYLNQPRLEKPVEPRILQIAGYSSPSIEGGSAVSGLSWSSWGEATATGTGEATVEWGTAATGFHQEHASIAVEVSATGRQLCDGIPIYTVVELAPAPGVAAPPHFSLFQHDNMVLPCEVHGGNFVAEQKEERTDPRGCFFSGVSTQLLFRSVPTLRFGVGYCAMHWTGWGSDRAVGIGVGRKIEQQYGIRVILSRPEWCPAWTVSYTQETAELWGSGEPLTGHGNVSQAAAKRLESEIGRQGQRRWTAHDATPASAGCQPPSAQLAQNASRRSSVAASPSVFLNVPMMHPERPTTIPGYELNEPDVHDPAKFLSVETHVNGLAWSSWGGSTATGSGQVEVRSSDTRPGHSQPYASQSAAVSIVASGLVSCGDRQLYTAYTLTVTGAEAEPRDFSYVKDRSLPCRMQALAYYAGIEKVANTTGDCLFRGVTEQLPSGFGYLGYCQMQWKSWGNSSTTGTGIARAILLPHSCDGHEECDYGIRVDLSTPAWCPAYGMSYTREKLEVFGRGVPLSGEPQTETGVIAPSVDRRLQATVGHGRPRVFHEAVRKSQKCEQ
jgi:hypothetical protein